MPESDSTVAEGSSVRLRREDKARKVVESLAVKLHKFSPSGRNVWTVVGSDGDFLVDLGSTGSKPYCSCSDFYFRVLSGLIPECYHLIATKTAVKDEMYSVVEFSDEEFPGFMRALVLDNFSQNG
ncbi:MAG: hypothetical protein OK457_10135 [Thaumarchaeota archaeon]|nr:hypothetical protein [Nitrososphaerota archaeon]